MEIFPLLSLYSCFSGMTKLQVVNTELQYLINMKVSVLKLMTFTHTHNSTCLLHYPQNVIRPYEVMEIPLHLS